MLRGHKWKMLDAAMGAEEVTSREFSAVTGIAAAQCHPYAHLLERDGYLRLVREVPPDRGGRPVKVYVWTGKLPADDPTPIGIIRGDADHLVNACVNAMIRCKEKADDALKTLACAL